MKVNDLMQSKHRNKIGVIIIIAAIIGLYFTGGFGMGPGDVYDQEVTNYGDWYLYETSSGDPITNGMTIDAANGLKVVFIPDDITRPESLICSLYRDGWQWIEAGEGGFQTSAYIWYFDLDATDEGVHSYFVAFSGEDGSWMVSGVTYLFNVDNTQAATYDDPEIFVRPEDAHFDLGETSAYLMWSYRVYGPSTLTITVNGDVARTDSVVAVSGITGTSFNIDTSVDGTQNIVFRLSTDGADNDAVDDVEVIVELASVAYDDPAITAGPVDQEFLIDSTIVLEWGYMFELSAVLTLYIDNVEIETEDYAGYDTEQLYTYSFTPENETDYTVKFELVPDDSTYITVTDEVVITGTITTPTTTTTTGTTTTIPPGPVQDYTLLIAGIAAVVIVGFIIKKRREEY